MRQLKIIGAVALLCVGVLYGCAGAVLTGAGGGKPVASEQQRNDRAVIAAVTRALVRERSVNAMDIDVQSRDGLVTLTGRVPTYAAARRAGQLAAQVPGVKDVQLQLAIEP
jgi:osmotically-inducible protein OsmY